MGKDIDDGLQHEGNWHILVAGLARPPEAITLAPGLTLRGLREPLTVFDLAAAGAAGFSAWAVLEPLASTCNCEMESARDSDVRPGYDIIEQGLVGICVTRTSRIRDTSRSSLLLLLMGYDSWSSEALQGGFPTTTKGRRSTGCCV